MATPCGENAHGDVVTLFQVGEKHAVACRYGQDRQSQMIQQQIRDLPARIEEWPQRAGSPPVVAELAEFPMSNAALPAEPTICRLDTKDRFQRACLGAIPYREDEIAEPTAQSAVAGLRKILGPPSG